MKNNVLFLIAAAVFALTSCGTTNQVAYNSSHRYNNSIYYNPVYESENTNYAKEQQQLEQLHSATNMALEGNTQYSVYDKSTKTETIYVGNSNEVNIDYNPNITYAIVDDQESYEARLRKFDSPTYTINIETDYYDYYNYYNPWWDIRFSWSYPYTYHYRGYYSWRWYDYWYNPWIDPWYGPGYYHHPYIAYYPPYYYPYYPKDHFGYYPGPAPGPGAKPAPSKGVYYGKRSNTGAYAQRGTNGISSPANKISSNREQGSITRRNNLGSQVRGTNTIKQGSESVNKNNNSSGSRYTRKSTNVTGSKSNVTANRNSSGSNKVSRGHSSYSRSSNSSATRNSSSSSNINYNSRSTSGGSNISVGSGGGASSSSGGSVYRRR